LSALRPPFLKDLVWRDPPADRTVYPFSLPCLAEDGFRIAFEAPLAVFSGENGSGKSTLLEAIADHIGLGRGGGSKDHRDVSGEAAGGLAKSLRFPGCPK
jgi:predicted ATPase